MFTIYALLDPFTGNPRYVGRTKHAADFRATAHWNTRKHHPCCRQWLTSLEDVGQKPEVHILSTGETEKKAENRWIELFTMQGFSLLNIYQMPKFKKSKYKKLSPEKNRAKQARWVANHREHRNKWQREAYHRRKHDPAFSERARVNRRASYYRAKLRSEKQPFDLVATLKNLWVAVFGKT